MGFLLSRISPYVYRKEYECRSRRPTLVGFSVAGWTIAFVPEVKETIMLYKALVLTMLLLIVLILGILYRSGY